MVDDRLADRETLKAVLEEKGYKVATAGDGKEAIGMVKQKHYDIIFMDVRLPDMSGVETFEEVKKIDPDVAVIMMTGYSEEELMRKAIAEGAYTCIYKPFDLDKLTALVEQISSEKGK